MAESDCAQCTSAVSRAVESRGVESRTVEVRVVESRLGTPCAHAPGAQAHGAIANPATNMHHRFTPLRPPPQLAESVRWPAAEDQWPDLSRSLASRASADAGYSLTTRCRSGRAVAVSPRSIRIRARLYSAVGTSRL